MSTFYCVFVCQFVEQIIMNKRMILNITYSGLLNSKFTLNKCMNVIALDITISTYFKIKGN